MQTWCLRFGGTAAHAIERRGVASRPLAIAARPQHWAGDLVRGFLLPCAPAAQRDSLLARARVV
jgi:hypothetical protein